MSVEATVKAGAPLEVDLVARLQQPEVGLVKCLADGSDGICVLLRSTLSSWANEQRMVMCMLSFSCSMRTTGAASSTIPENILSAVCSGQR